MWADQLTYSLEDTNCWPSLLHLLYHPTRIPHISSNLIANILWREDEIMQVMLYLLVVGPIHSIWIKWVGIWKSWFLINGSNPIWLTWLKACNLPLIAAAPVVTCVFLCHLSIDLSLKTAILQDKSSKSFKLLRLRTSNGCSNKKTMQATKWEKWSKHESPMSVPSAADAVIA